MQKLLALSVMVAAGCAGVPTKASPNDPAGNFFSVSEGLYRGGRPDEAGYDNLVKMGVKTVIDLENDEVALEQERAWVDARHITFIHAPMSGTSTPDDDQTNRVLAHLADKTLYPIFVHCMKGMDRTGAIIALHRRYNEGWTAQDAFQEMESMGFNDLLFSLKGYVKRKLGM